MNPMVLAALRRKLVMYESAGMTDRAEYTAYRIAQAEAEPEPAGTIEVDYKPDAEGPRPWLKKYDEADALAGVALTPASHQRARELGLTAEDFKDQDPTGKANEFLVSDVVRIYDAKTTPNMTEADIDGD